MKTFFRKKLFQHGGSKAVDLPMEAFAKKHASNEVIVEVREDGVFIYLDELTTMESDPRFHLFIEALLQDAMNHPDRLKPRRGVG